jgi:hypothetical protein
MVLAERTATAEQGRADTATSSDIKRKDALAKAAAKRPKPKPAK